MSLAAAQDWARLCLLARKNGTTEAEAAGVAKVLARLLPALATGDTAASFEDAGGFEAALRQLATPVHG